MRSGLRYEIILYWSPEDEAYVAEVPERTMVDPFRYTRQSVLG